MEDFYLDRDSDGICVSASTLVKGSSNVMFSRYLLLWVFYSLNVKDVLEPNN